MYYFADTIAKLLIAGMVMIVVGYEVSPIVTF